MKNHVSLLGGYGKATKKEIQDLFGEITGFF